MTFTKNGKNRLDEVSAPIERSTEQRPKGQAIFVRQIYSFKKFTIARLIAVGLSALLLPSIALAEPDTEKPYLLPEIIIQSLRGDPTVGRSAALSCQAIFSLGQRRAERKVQLSATIDGEREVLSNLRGPVSPHEPNPSDRSYNQDLDNVFDAEILARYRTSRIFGRARISC